jgi:EpsI family protein
MKPMKKPFIVSLVLGILMVLSGGLTWVMTPTMQDDGQQDKINLEAMIPGSFDNWKIEPATTAAIVNPDDNRLVSKIYDQTLSRTYINTAGERVMLSIAYGRNQSTDLHEVHRPEVCYAAGGFDIGKMTKTFVNTTIGQIPVMRLVAKQGTRNEPITYWVRVGDSLTRGWIEQKMAAIFYGLTRKAPDGLLFRMSTISNDEQESYRIQQAFLVAMLKEVKSGDRFWLVGKLTP